MQVDVPALIGMLVTLAAGWVLGVLCQPVAPRVRAPFRALAVAAGNFARAAGAPLVAFRRAAAPPRRRDGRRGRRRRGMDRPAVTR
jgi:hypothetical protein